MLFGIYPNKLKTCDHTKRCTQVFIAAVFIIAKICNQPKCPSVGKWINTPVYIKAMEYYSIFPILLFIIYYIIYIIYYIGYILDIYPILFILEIYIYLYLYYWLYIYPIIIIVYIYPIYIYPILLLDIYIQYIYPILFIILFPIIFQYYNTEYYSVLKRNKASSLPEGHGRNSSTYC